MNITPRAAALSVSAPVVRGAKALRPAAWGFLLPARGCSGATLARVPPRGARFLVEGFSVLRVGLLSYGGVEVFWWL